MKLTQEQLDAWKNQLSTFGEAIIDKTRTEIAGERTERVNADGQILSQIDALKGSVEGKGSFVYVDQEANGKSVEEILKAAGKNLKDATYIIKYKGTEEITVISQDTKVALGNDDALIVTYDTKGNILSVIADDNTVDVQLAQARAYNDTTFATNNDLTDVVAGLLTSISDATLRVRAY